MASKRLDTGHQAIGACFGCRGCGQQSSQLSQPLSPQVRLKLFSNTLMLPLLGFVCGSVVANYLYAHEVSQIAGAIIGFAIGMFCCRPVSLVTDKVLDHA